jgi:hypothetical protein
MAWAILVVGKNGEEEYLREGLGDSTARFRSRSEATKLMQFMKIGMEDEYQSINVVRCSIRAAKNIGDRSD